MLNIDKGSTGQQFFYSSEKSLTLKNVKSYMNKTVNFRSWGRRGWWWWRWWRWCWWWRWWWWRWWGWWWRLTYKMFTFVIIIKMWIIYQSDKFAFWWNMFCSPCTLFCTKIHFLFLKCFDQKSYKYIKRETKQI